MQQRVVTGHNGERFYITIDDDMLDLIAYAHYGKHERNTEMLLEANPHVLRYGVRLPAGVPVRLPPAARHATPTPFRQLWD